MTFQLGLNDQAWVDQARIGMEKSQEEEDPTYMHQAGWGKEK